MQRDFLPIAFGVALTAVLSGTFVIAGLKAGITPGVSPLVILCAWGFFAGRTQGKGGGRFLNLTQVAGSAGMAVTAGVIFTAPVAQIIPHSLGEPVPPVDVWTLVLLSLAGSLIGYGFVGLATGKFLSDPTLPAPEARACETMIESAVAGSGQRPRMGRSLFASLGLAFLATLAIRANVLASNWHLIGGNDENAKFKSGLHFDVMLIGIGGLLTLPTALLVFGGAFIRSIAEWWVLGLSPSSVWHTRFVASTAEVEHSLRWMGGATMLVAVIYSLIKFARPRPKTTVDVGDESLLEIEAGWKRKLQASVWAGTLLLLGWVVLTAGVNVFSVSMSITILVMAFLMVTLGAILSLQVGSSASPVSGTIFVTTLVLCAVARQVGSADLSTVAILVPLIVAACVAVCTANDSSQDYKTMQLCGVKVQDGFLAQILGLLVGCIVVPFALAFAHETYSLVPTGIESSPGLKAPQANLFATLINGILLEARLPWWPILAGGVLGLFAVALEIGAEKKRLLLPAMALAVGIYLPASVGIGILIGALFRFFGEWKSRRQTNESILSAAGLITGSAALDLVLGVAILFGFNADSLAVTETAIPWTTAVGILLVGSILYYNSRTRRSLE